MNAREESKIVAGEVETPCATHNELRARLQDNTARLAAMREDGPVRQELEGEIDLGSGHHWFALDDGDALWHDGKCPSWHRVDLTSGTHHRFVEPFTVVGSLPCHVCGAHGFITNGRWADA